MRYVDHISTREIMYMNCLIKAIHIIRIFTTSSRQFIANIGHQQENILFHVIGKVCTYFSYMLKLP